MDAYVPERPGRRELVVADTNSQHWVVGVFRQHPALFVSAFYVLASVIGMFFAWDYLRHFGINVLNYSEVTDFLMASIKEPMTWVMSFLALGVMFLDNASSRRWGSKERPRLLRWYGSPRYRASNYIVVFLVAGVLIDAYARVKSVLTMQGQGEVVELRLADSEVAETRMLLGTTGRYVFVYDLDSGHADVHPLENVMMIRAVSGSGDERVE